MIVAIDIGNSEMKAGVFNKNRLVYAASCPSSSAASCKKLLQKLRLEYKKSGVESTGISSVVSGSKKFWKGAVSSILGVEPVFISRKMSLPIRMEIDNPSKLGPDRICNAVAGYEFFKEKENVIAVDFGTATTFDVILRNGDYLGGIIAPGILTASYSLYLRTSQLPLLDFSGQIRFPANPIAKSTLNAMQSGILYSALDSMEGMIKRIQESLQRKFKVILTGGLAKVIHRKTKYPAFLVENLVLHGINYILRYNHES